jgi:hypothetical protein
VASGTPATRPTVAKTDNRPAPRTLASGGCRTRRCEAARDLDLLRVHTPLRAALATIRTKAQHAASVDGAQVVEKGVGDGRKGPAEAA